MRTRHFGSDNSLRGEYSVEDALPPIAVLQQEDILDEVWEAGLWDSAVKTGLQERGPPLLQGPLPTHVPLHKWGNEGLCHYLQLCFHISTA